jgi:gluconokinase
MNEGDARPDVRLVYLKSTHDLIARRIATRHGHFMPSELLDSQFAALEELRADERPIVASIAPHSREIVKDIVSKLEEGVHRQATRGQA